MLVKLSDGAGGWVFFDNAEQVRVWGGPPLRAKNQTELDGVVPKEFEPVNLVPRAAFKEGSTVEYRVVEFRRGGQWSAALFTNVGWICNDAGDTLERVNVGRQESNFQKGRR